MHRPGVCVQVYACMTSTSGHDDADTLPALTSAYGTGLWMSAESEATQAAGSEGPTHSNGGGEVREPAFTTCTPTFTATIDYVFSWGVAPVRVRPLPARKSLGVGLPNGGHPSDHLPLVVDFCVEQQQQQ
jgi:mRNA deadenylase 3'-5' endonuclease subunit Ccr4